MPYQKATYRENAVSENAVSENAVSENAVSEMLYRKMLYRENHVNADRHLNAIQNCPNVPHVQNRCQHFSAANTWTSHAKRANMEQTGTYMWSKTLKTYHKSTSTDVQIRCHYPFAANTRKSSSKRPPPDLPFGLILATFSIKNVSKIITKNEAERV